MLKGLLSMLNKVYFIDNLLFMKTKPDNFYDLANVDVNYGIGQGGLKNHSRGNRAEAKKYIDYGDFKSPDKEYFTELFRISKNQIVWGANHFISKIPYDSSCWIVWDKCNNTTNQADSELAWTSFKTAVRNFRFMWNGMLQGKSISEGHTQIGNKLKNEVRIHPNQKPIMLYKWTLQNYAKPGFKIFDSNVGSGSHRIACYDMGFYFEGCENHEHYWQEQENRYNNHKHQDLFQGE